LKLAMIQRLLPGSASPSPRKAWIETASSGGEICQARVAFPPEGVD